MPVAFIPPKANDAYSPFPPHSFLPYFTHDASCVMLNIDWKPLERSILGFMVYRYRLTDTDIYTQCATGILYMSL